MIKVTPEIIGKKIRTLRFDPWISGRARYEDGGLIGTIVHADPPGTESPCVQIEFDEPVNSHCDVFLWWYQATDVEGYNG